LRSKLRSFGPVRLGADGCLDGLGLVLAGLDVCPGCGLLDCRFLGLGSFFGSFLGGVDDIGRG
jgi:hypothetical protein